MWFSRKDKNKSRIGRPCQDLFAINDMFEIHVESEVKFEAHIDVHKMSSHISKIILANIQDWCWASWLANFLSR